MKGLRGKPGYAGRLETCVAAVGGVHHVRANAITGNVLILFDAGQLDLRRLVAAVVQHAGEVREGPGRPAPQADVAWHAIAAAAVAARLRTSPATGLTTEDAARRLADLGENRLPVPQPKAAFEILAGQLTSLPVLLLGGAAALSLAVGAVVDAVVILAVVGANAIVGYLTESRVERILASLQNGSTPPAFLRRDGQEVVLPASELVPGDIILLKPGHTVPADARLIAADRLALDESTLTGESLPVAKIAAPACGADAALPDRVTMVFAATVVSEGSGVAIVIGTGRETEIGRIRALVAETSSPPTPLERQLDRMGRQLVGVSVGFCGLALIMGLLRGVPALEMLRTAVSLAVAAVPEGLPAVATTTLALGMQRMMRQRMLVRRLAAVEGLGATTVICADKTGTLTENRMSVYGWYLCGREYPTPRAGAAKEIDPDQLLARALAISVLCNEADLAAETAEVTGSSTEGALLKAAVAAGVDYRVLRQRYPLQTLRPRSEGDNWMATVHVESASHWLVMVKGAPEEVLELAESWLEGEVVRPLTSEARHEIIEVNARIAARGMRMLALAFKQIPAGAAPTYDGLTWVGLVALSDPIRAGVREAILACRRAGIRPVILTGDQARTAAAIYRDLDPARNGSPRVIEAAQLARMDRARLAAVVSEVDVFARVSPGHKYQIVRAFQAGGHVVAMTGDGINDAAALRAADIGVAMGARGTDVARDVADVILIDDDFGSIVKAVEQGRTIHANIGKALRFLLSTNFSEILVTLGALALGAARPMSAIQFLWINLLSDVFPALALAMEPPEPDVMGRPPLDPAEPILSRSRLVEIGGDAATLSFATLGVHGLAVARYGAGPHATTIAFCTLTAAQLVHALSYRSGWSEPNRIPLLETVVGGTLAVHLTAMTASPLRRVLGTTVLSASDWTLVASGVAVPLALRALKKAFTAPALPAIQTTRAQGVRQWQPSTRFRTRRRSGRLGPTKSRPS